MFKHVGKETLREILCVVHGVPATPHESIKRRPITSAKFCQRSPRHLRFGFASPGREHYAPMSRRKYIAATVIVCHEGIQVNGFFQD
jgi:hypothetical protein